ncbi:hypothetical protein [Flavobacterium sp. UBA6135]|uniref:hypothetical protein n=1 Tax=Flavobacterium sp. UBA6135 TaxID=1946553 RepID=UPI0025C2939A|nr:hypothetical protein [Flavobacterium sp. UBA6135]
MKTYVMVFLFVGLTNQMIAQPNEIIVQPDEMIAYTPSNQKVYATSKTALHSEYLKTVTKQDLAVKIQTFQNAIANYDITSSDVYQPNAEASYTVNFNEGNNHITAIYDKDGQLVSSEENYKGIRLPYKLASKLTKEYPNWGIEKVNCQILFSSTKQESSIAYKVVLSNGKKLKKITIQI